MTYELYTTKHWMILPSFVHGILPTLMHNSNNHIALGVVEKKRPFLAVAGGSDYIRDEQVTEDGEMVPRYDGWGENLLAQMREPFVNVIPIDGPITRNGDACSYGSKEIRDWMMEAAGNKYCRAHALVINTPGGSAWAKNDFQQAIDFAHQKGQRVYGLIDGLCASAGMYLASFCDEVYVVNPKDQLGCVGVMASFFTLGDGEKLYTNETYHEYYATKSVNKNKEYRDIANDNDATLLIEELDKLEAEFRADMQRSFPDATDDHLDGKVFYADEVMGILCDGQMMLGDVVARAFAVADGSEEPIARTAGRNVGQPANVDDDDNDDDDPTAAALASAVAAAGRIAATMDNVSPKNSTTMTNEKYQKVAQVLGVEELTVTEEGTFLNAPLLDTLAEKLAEMQTKVAEAEGLQTKIDELTKQLDEQKNPAGEAAGEKAQEQAGAQAAAAEENAGEQGCEGAAPAAEPAAEPASQEAIENAAAEIDKITETLHTAEQKIAEKDAEIAQLKETLATLNGIAEERDAAIQERNDISASLEKAGLDYADQGKALTDAEAKIAEHVATIEKLQKQVKELQSEVKELSEKPAPMVDAGAGIPQDNGTGEGPKKQERITSDMSYEEIQEFEKRKREKK
jgi:protease-4